MWLTQQQIAKLFNRNKSVISRHINSILKNELEKETTVALFATVQKEGKRKVIRKVEHYNLDVIISVGYKVNSKQGVIFRRWSTKILKDYLIKGYAVNKEKLHNLEKAIKLIDIANRVEDNNFLNIINKYSKTTPQ